MTTAPLDPKARATETRMLDRVSRCAVALERIADALEEQNRRAEHEDDPRSLLPNYKLHLGLREK